MRERVASLRKQINEAHMQMNDSREEFIDIQDMVEQMVHKFKVAQFGTRIASGMVYSDTTQFTESNIQQYLAELEELITKLITSVAAIRGDPNAAISAMNMNRLTIKDFNKKEMKIDMSGEADARGNSARDYDHDEIDYDVIQNREKLYAHYANKLRQAQMLMGGEVDPSEAVNDDITCEATVLNKDE